MENLLAMAKLPTGLYVFVMGFLIVFLGMAVIITVISIIGKILTSLNKKKVKKAENKQEAVIEEVVLDSDDEEEARIRAAIVAVLTNYYFNQGSNCEFKIKKIRRI